MWEINWGSISTRLFIINAKNDFPMLSHVENKLKLSRLHLTYNGEDISVG